MYNYGNPSFYQYLLYQDIPYYFDNRSYYNQYKFNSPTFHPMYNHWQFDMPHTYRIRQTNKGDRLHPGERLLPGESLQSKNGQYVLIMQGDGNLVLYQSGVALWASGTNGKKVDSAVLQDDGNFVIYGEGGALWATRTSGNRVAYLVVQDDGNVVIYDVNGKPVWAWKTSQQVAKDRLHPGERLLPGESLQSKNGQYVLIMQGDGNLVLYQSGVALWASGTNGKKVDFAILQDDGNFVIYGEGGALWATRTSGNRVAYLVVQDDGNVVIYDVNGKPVWARKNDSPVVTPDDELVVLTKTLTSFHYPHTLFQTRKFRVYLEVRVPKKIAETMQSSLDNCMEVAKGKAAPALGGCITIPTCMAVISAALKIAVSTFTTCVAANPQLYPYIDKMKIDVKTDKNA